MYHPRRAAENPAEPETGLPPTTGPGLLPTVTVPINDDDGNAEASGPGPAVATVDPLLAAVAMSVAAADTVGSVTAAAAAGAPASSSSAAGPGSAAAPQYNTADNFELGDFGAEAAAVPDDEIATQSDRTECPTDGSETVAAGDETDEERGELAQSLAGHFAAIEAMGLMRPPLPRPVQESRRSWLRRVKKKQKKKKAGKSETN